MGTPAAFFTCKKTYRNLPCAHRRWRHGGACAWIHGYSREVTLEFGCRERTENGFVVDFGELKPVKGWLEDHFDHTLLIDQDDPLLPSFQALAEQGACRLVVYDDVGMEGSARFIFDWVDPWIRAHTQNRAWLLSVECRENDKNAASYRPHPTPLFSG